jgi:hypothetical protein
VILVVVEHLVLDWLLTGTERLVSSVLTIREWDWMVVSKG